MDLAVSCVPVDGVNAIRELYSLCIIAQHALYIIIPFLGEDARSCDLFFLIGSDRNEVERWLEADIAETLPR